MAELTREDLKVGRVYCAKRPRPIMLGFDRLYNDRQIRWMGAFEMQYDGPTVKNGSRYPRITIEKFLKWADRDVTDECPPGDWRPYGPHQKP